jgi:hypothetical protein
MAICARNAASAVAESPSPSFFQPAASSATKREISAWENSGRNPGCGRKSRNSPMVFSSAPSCGLASMPRPPEPQPTGVQPPWTLGVENASTADITRTDLEETFKAPSRTLRRVYSLSMKGAEEQRPHALFAPRISGRGIRSGRPSPPSTGGTRCRSRSGRPGADGWRARACTGALGGAPPGFLPGASRTRSPRRGCSA